MRFNRFLLILTVPLLLFSQTDTVSYNQIKIIPGSFVPEFSALDENGKLHQLSKIKGKENLILIFFRGYW